MSEDYRIHCQNIHRVQDMVVTEIRGYLKSMGKNIKEFNLLKITDDVNLQCALHREVQEEYKIVVEPEHLSARDSLNCDRKIVYDEIMMHVDNDRPGLFFIDGPGGTGKTFVYKALLAQVRSRGLIALATASSGAAANNMPGGRTAHSRLKIPINLNNNSMCKIKHQSGTAELIRSAKQIIWDEASMAKRQAIKAVDRTLQDIIGVRLPFGGKIMVMGGDFRQVFPVVKRGTRAQTVDSSFRMSPLWRVTKKMRLTINMRALNDSWFSDFLLIVGDGTEESIDENFIRIPDDMTIPFTSKENSIKELFNAIFPSIENSVCTLEYIASRAILSTRNESVDEIIDQMIDNFQGEEMVYYSFDEVEDDIHNFYPTEFLNSLNVSVLPPHKLRLKIGCPMILIQNIDPSRGLCNGTRLICKGFHRNSIDAEIAAGQHSGERVFLIRIPLSLFEDV
ncbi:ATP-dependent DNA helicase PIF1-like [Bidens hawaiensis]|uniref:ATP-dependent DNA helicase PIF1-like n=1 Tax=Bidens hawaiensis TaxID=980011 RepID=UPI00404A0E15